MMKVVPEANAREEGWVGVHSLFRAGEAVEDISLWTAPCPASLTGTLRICTHLLGVNITVGDKYTQR